MALNSNSWLLRLVVRVFGGSLILALLFLTGGVILLGGLLSAFSSAGQQAQSSGVDIGWSNPVTQAARAMAAGLADCRGLDTPNAIANGCNTVMYPKYAALNAKFPADILAWGRANCHNCFEWQDGSFQCVSFVVGAYSQFAPLSLVGNGNQFWDLYNQPAARSAGWITIEAGKGLPMAPGDIMAWSGGDFGHVSIVLGWQAPQGNTPGKIVFAQANAGTPIEEMPILPNLQIDTSRWGGGYHVQGYIHTSKLSTAAPPPGKGSGIVTANSSVLSAPSISAQKIDEILCNAGSPACGSGAPLYQYGVRFGIDPAFALAFFKHESSFGTQGIARDTRSLGNIRCSAGYSCTSGFRAYATWADGYLDWYRLIKEQYVDQWHKQTIHDILTTYAPTSENDTNAYIQTVCDLVNQWRNEV